MNWLKESSIEKHLPGPSLRKKIWDKLRSILDAQENWTLHLTEIGNQTLNRLQALQSPLARNELLYPRRNIGKASWILHMSNVDYPYKFDTVDLWSENMDMGRKWFRFSGTNKDGKWFMISWPISGNCINIKHIWLDPELRWWFGQRLLNELENCSKIQWIESIFAYFSNERTLKLFNQNGYEKPWNYPWDSHCANLAILPISHPFDQQKQLLVKNI